MMFVTSTAQDSTLCMYIVIHIITALKAPIIRCRSQKLANYYFKKSDCKNPGLQLEDIGTDCEAMIDFSMS